MPQSVTPLRFIFITPCVVEDFFKPVRQGASDAAAALGVEYEFTGTEEVDIPAQVELVTRAVADGYHGIALSVCHPTAFNDAVAEALAAGIPVVAFNIDDRSGNNPRLAGIVQDGHAAGRSLAGRIAGRIEGGGRVLVTKHSEGISALEQRVAGVEEVLHAAGLQTRVLVTGMFASEAQNRIADALADDPCAAIVATGQADTEGAGLAVEQQPARIPVAGFDLSQQILRLVREGVILCTIDQQPYLQGFYPVVQLAHHVRFGLAPSDIDAGAAVVTAANADAVAELCAEDYR